MIKNPLSAPELLQASQFDLDMASKATASAKSYIPFIVNSDKGVSDHAKKMYDIFVLLADIYIKRAIDRQEQAAKLIGI